MLAANAATLGNKAALYGGKSAAFASMPASPGSKSSWPHVTINPRWPRNAAMPAPSLKHNGNHYRLPDQRVPMGFGALKRVRIN